MTKITMFYTCLIFNLVNSYFLYILIISSDGLNEYPALPGLNLLPIVDSLKQTLLTIIIAMFLQFIVELTSINRTNIFNNFFIF